MTTNTGGAAFPYAAVHGCNGEYGMTLRDYFAAKAMQTYMADENLMEVYSSLGKNVKKEVSTIAYMMADAMLEAREK